MIEDSENGVRSAYAAGGQVILVRDIKRLDPEVEAVAARVYDSLAEFLHELGTSVPKLPVPLLTETFPQTPNAHRVGIHGFGAMGGGFLAQVFSHWDGYTKPRELIGVTGDALLRDAVNSFGKMSVRYGRHAFDQTIPNVRLVPPSDVDAVVGMYRDSRVVALAIPEQAVAVHAPLIAAGLLARQRGSGEPLSVLVVMNKVGGGRFVREQVESELAAMTDPPECERVLAATEFCETVVSRVVSRVDRDALLRQIRIRCDVFERNLAAVQQERGGTDPPTDPATEGERGLASLRKASEYAKALNELHLVPFTSEADMNLFAESKDPVVRSLRQVVIVDDMPSIQTIKNRVWNGTHAIIAWYAAMLGYPSIGQAMTDAAVIALVRQLIDCEITPAIEAENPHLGRAVHAFMAPFIDCCRMSFLDPVQRVGRDPLRKLQRDERIVGSIFAAAAHGIPTPALEYALAVALRYALSERCGDDQECALIRELYERDPRPEGILTYTGSYNGGAYLCLDPDHDAPLIARVVEHFVKLGDTTGEHWRWPLANA